MAIAQSPLHSFALLLLLLAASASASAQHKCNPDDKNVLLGIKKFYRNAPAFSSWSPSTDCCSSWDLITCNDTTHRIFSLTLNNINDLSGIISPAIGDLPFLHQLTFSVLPNISGPIPRSLSKLRYLTVLQLNNNQLTGPIPDYLHTLKNLYYINLSYNKLSGSIPPSLALVQATDFLLSNNRLTGPIPGTFASFKNRAIFNLLLSDNELSGPIPASLGEVNVTMLDLSRNKLTGDASFLFGESKALFQLGLAENSLAFDMSKLEVPPGVVSLHLEHNMIYGSLPPSLTRLASIIDFNVSYNSLCGKIPTGGRLGEFDKYSFFHNKCLCGSPLAACK